MITGGTFSRGARKTGSSTPMEGRLHKAFVRRSTENVVLLLSGSEYQKPMLSNVKALYSRPYNTYCRRDGAVFDVFED